METLRNQLPAKFGMKDQISLTDLCQSLKKELGKSLESMILYGNATLQDYHPESGDKNVLVVVKQIDASMLKHVLKSVHKAKRMGIETSFITRENLISSTDVFPIKYQSMSESYVVIYGDNVMESLEISRVHLRLRCEQELRSFSRRLQKYFLDEQGKHLKEMLCTAITEFIETLRVAVMLKTKEMPTWEESIEQVTQTFKVDALILKELMKLRNDQVKPRKKEVEDYYNRFMLLADQMVGIVDRMDEQE